MVRGRVTRPHVHPHHRHHHHHFNHSCYLYLLAAWLLTLTSGRQDALLLLRVLGHTVVGADLQAHTQTHTQTRRMRGG